MKLHKVKLLILTLIIILILTSCDIAGQRSTDSSGNNAENGTITVTLINAGSHNGDTFYFCVYEADDLTSPIAKNTFVISGGTGSAVSLDVNTALDYEFTGGITYKIIGFIDDDGDQGLSGYEDQLPDNDSDDYTSEISAYVDGDITVTVDYTTDITVQ